MYIELNDINKSFGSYRASEHVSFGIEKGKLVGLLGPSGSGKTTILRMIAGLEYPDSGVIRIDGRIVNDVPAHIRGIGFVFQNYALFQHMSIYENIAFGLRLQKKDKKEIKNRVNELLELVSLVGLEKRYPHQLSGGQRQRVAFARALAPNPQLLLLDEPFAAIDAKVRKELRTWLKELVEKIGITSIFVTHDQEEAVEVADEIIITNKGRVEQVGSPTEIYRLPKTPFVARFIGKSTVLQNYETLKGFQAVEGAESAVVRPEFVKIFKKNEKVLFRNAVEAGIITEAAFRGDSFLLTVSIGEMQLYAKRELGEEEIFIGEEVAVLIYRLCVFDHDRTYLQENKNLSTENLFYI